MHWGKKFVGVWYQFGSYKIISHCGLNVVIEKLAKKLGQGGRPVTRVTVYQWPMSKTCLEVSNKTSLKSQAHRDAARERKCNNR